ncbi:M60 family metallopeptidase [Kitasatospora sp. NPDC002040]|uniref:M60 family metallopeptidase n=1 Tax=Kitasatospora sp. NPDC002040 TaxID=3154661 RepID=UPI0033276BC3
MTSRVRSRRVLLAACSIVIVATVTPLSALPATAATAGAVTAVAPAPDAVALDPALVLARGDGSPSVFYRKTRETVEISAVPLDTAETARLATVPGQHLSQVVAAGYYLPKGTDLVLDVVIPPGGTLTVGIGTPDMTIADTGDKAKGEMRFTDVSASGRVTVTDTYGVGGEVYLALTGPVAAGQHARVAFPASSGARPLPFFQWGVTTPAQFRQQLGDLPDAPRAQLMGPHTLLTLERATALKYQDQDQDRLLAIYEKAIAAEDALVGLDGSSPRHSRSPLPFHFVFSDYLDIGGAYTSKGFMAIGPTWTYWSLKLAELAKPDHEAVWHEVGHVQQPRAVSGTGYTERDVDIYGNAAIRAVTGQPGLDKSTWDKALDDIAGWKAGVDDAAKRSDAHRWSQVACLDQIRIQSGDRYWADMHKLIRDNAFPTLKAQGDTAFPVYASAAAGYNVAPHFERCGYPVTPDAKTYLTTLNLPTAPAELPTRSEWPQP